MKTTEKPKKELQIWKDFICACIGLASFIKEQITNNTKNHIIEGTEKEKLKNRLVENNKVKKHNKTSVKIMCLLVNTDTQLRHTHSCSGSHVQSLLRYLESLCIAFYVTVISVDSLCCSCLCFFFHSITFPCNRSFALRTFTCESFSSHRGIPSSSENSMNSK